jgi:hypothetical protein
VLLGLGWFITNWLNIPLAATAFWPFAVGISLYLGISAGLAYGSLAALQQKQLHRVLNEQQLAPIDYVHFLDYAAERNLLRKVGGGYMFVHLLLLDYFRETAKSNE